MELIRRGFVGKVGLDLTGKKAITWAERQGWAPYTV